MSSPRVVWQRRTDSSKRIWARVDGVLVVGEELIDIGTGQAFAEPPWRFLGLGPWSRQRWEPEMVPPGAQGPRGGDRVQSRLWNGHLVAAKYVTGATWEEGGVLIEARDAASRRPSRQHQVAGVHEQAMWSNWLEAGDGAVIKRPSDGRFIDYRTLRYPDPGTGGCRWWLSWDSAQWGDRAQPGEDLDEPGDDTGELITIFDGSHCDFATLDAGSGRVLWRGATPEGTIAAEVRACDEWLVVCSFPEDVNRFKTRLSHGPHVPVVLAGACSCGRRVPGGREPNSCQGCGGFIAPWLAVSVYDRRDGTRLWSHRWPWDDPLGHIFASVEAFTVARSPAGWVIVTQEGPVLRARRLADSGLLWSTPVSGLPLPPRPSGGPFGFNQAKRGGVHRWAWLQEWAGSVAEGTRMTTDLFLHPVTGARAVLTNVLCLSEQGLAVTVTGEAATCYALPDD